MLPRPTLLRLLILLLALLAGCLISLWVLRRPRPNHNALAFGPSAADTTLIPLQAPAELDFLTKAEVLALRRQAVQAHPELLAGEYSPSDAVFGQVVDGHPWWGIYGQFYYGSGERSIEGPAEESRFILNPYLLVAADFYEWWSGRITEAQLASFPLTCLPTNLLWQPRQSSAQAVYPMDCITRGGNYSFDLIAYNARDFNLNYIYVSYPDSLNVTKSQMPTAAYANPQYIHRGGSCGYPGGCNNMSPATPDIDGLQITRLPARLVVWLWKEQPAGLDQPPDFVFTIHFQ